MAPATPASPTAPAASAAPWRDGDIKVFGSLVTYLSSEAEHVTSHYAVGNNNGKIKNVTTVHENSSPHHRHTRSTPSYVTLTPTPEYNHDYVNASRVTHLWVNILHDSYPTNPLNVNAPTVPTKHVITFSSTAQYTNQRDTTYASHHAHLTRDKYFVPNTDGELSYASCNPPRLFSKSTQSPLFTIPGKPLPSR